MTFQAVPAGPAHTASPIWTMLTRLRAKLYAILDRAREHDAQERTRLELDRLDDFRLADLGLARRVEQVGWRSTIRGADPEPVMKTLYEPLAAEASAGPVR